MKNLSPDGKIYQAGTLSGNPLAMVAGITALKKLLNENVYNKLSFLGSLLETEFNRIVKPELESKKFKIDLIREDSIFWMNISENGSPTIRKVTDIWEKSSEIYSSIFWYLLENGVHIAPSAYEVGFISFPMEEKDIRLLTETLAEAVKNFKS
jgi:glutamate-1-semialdehyde 2,1-aminomutase